MPLSTHVPEIFDYVDEVYRDVHEHEVFFSFNNDDDADLFRQWMYIEGKDAYLTFRETMRAASR